MYLELVLWPWRTGWVKMSKNVAAPVGTKKLCAEIVGTYSGNEESEG